MAYLIEPDYLPIIQVGNKQALNQNNPTIQAKAESTALAEAISLLKSKFDTSAEFTPTMPWSPTGPASYPGRAYVDAGGLMSYGVVYADLERQLTEGAGAVLAGCLRREGETLEDVVATASGFGAVGDSTRSSPRCGAEDKKRERK